MPRVTITIPEKTAQPYRFQLDRQVVNLGRGSENDIVIESGSVSVHHAEMRRVEGGYELHDIDSTNGIKLDGVRQKVIPLLSGSAVHLGDVAFDFYLDGEESEALAREKPQPPAPIAREELPVRKPQPKASTYSPARSNSSSFAGTLLFIILAAAAFFAGLAIRHQKDTGGSLIEKILLNRAATSAPPSAGAPAEGQ